MNGSMKIAALLLAAMMPMTGCLGLFGDDESGSQADATSISENVDEETARQLESRAAGQFTNFTLPGQEDIQDAVVWLNGTLGSGDGAVAYEDRNDRAGTNYNTEIIASDITSQLPQGQPAEVHAKLWYLPGPGSSGDLDIYMNVPGFESEFAGDDCDAFSWKICVQEMTVPTVGTGEPAQVGVQVANGRVLQGMDYFLKVEVNYAKDVITPRVPYAFELPEEATGLVITSEKAGGSEHIQAELIVVGPDDQLVEYVTYNDISIPTESKLIPVSGAGEYIVYALELHGGFLGVEADVPVPGEMRQGRVLDIKEESVVDASQPAPGVGQICVPNTTPSPPCVANTTWTPGGTSSFAVQGTFPLEVRGFINDGGPAANVNAEVRILSSDGLVFRQSKVAQYEDDRGTIGLTRDTLNTWTDWANLASGEYTVEYVIDGNGQVGHTVRTYQR